MKAVDIKLLKVDVRNIKGPDFGPEDDPFKDFNHQGIRIRESDQLPFMGMPGYYIAWGGKAEDSA